MVIRPLAASDFDAVLEAFNAAFSDYVLPLTLTREQLAEMLRRRGWIPEVSIAAFEGDRIVALTLNAIEETRAYDTGTGVVPTHRRQGLGRAMMLRSIDVLRDRGCTSYVLEVIETNEKAVGLYVSLGFRETRGLQCWRYESQRLTGAHAHSDDDPVSLCGYEPVSPAWGDIHPSWQNTNASIARATDPHLTLGDEDGYAILFPATGDLAQLAVRPEARRRGIGTRLLREAAARSTQPLRIMNVDDCDAGITRFLEAAGAKRTVRQLEMVLAI
jgi:ribosomal protein S18 acetylase RimI-like enzyme